ncbi:MAG TPA: polynucleotide adenylyltransferase PcnB [Burkholderiaceae bacterium]|nr:polynucleotide adenylyltransferase PcnB [Burkholderiaceae bacterium]
MIKRLFDKLLGKPARLPLGKRLDVPEDEHGIDPSLVDEHAIRVVGTLKQAGHEAYIVGGAVRDLLVGRRPKDFDVATNATPEQVKALFRRAFVIGRRFRLVHVVFGRGREHEVIEVSTFRAYRDASEADTVEGNERTSKADLVGKTHVVDASGRVLRDNVWGPQIEDAARRDFTVNAMYYDPQTHIVVDFHRGIADAKHHVLRMIGDPATRYREDPVRLVRVVRFAAKLGFAIEKKTAAAMAEAVPLLANVPASRLFDEMVKLLQTGHALASIAALREYGLHRGVFPVLDAVFDEQRSTPQRQRFIDLALTDTDRRVAEGRAVVPSFLLACLLWHDVQSRWLELRQRGEHPTPALQQAIDAAFDARIGDVSGRGRLAADMREIWMMQPRFERRQANTAGALVAQPRFRAGYDFLRLRADAQEVDAELADWWEDFSLGDADEREALLQAAREAARRQTQPAAADAPAAAKKRRRRRRGGARRDNDGAAPAPTP